MKKQIPISLYFVTVILLVLTVCGSFWDLQIANAIYMGETPSDNLFGILVSYIGVIPTFVGWSFLGASILCLAKKQIRDIRKRRRLIAFSILLFLLSFFYFCNTLYISNANAFPIHFAVAYSIGLAVICPAAYLGYRLSQKNEDPCLLKKALFLAAITLITLIIISFTKELMCRPRFRFILATNNPAYFRNWWKSGRSLKMSLAANTVTDEFASFPSGHSGYAMFAIFLFPALGDYVTGLRKFKPYLFFFGFLWWAVTAFSRLTVGAHFLTDVTIAGLVTILAYTILSIGNRIFRFTNP